MTVDPHPDAIGRVMDDIRRGRVTCVERRRLIYDDALRTVADPVVVDATPLYDSVVEAGKNVAIYEDYPCIAPPWDESAVCYVNEHGNVVVEHMRVRDGQRGDPLLPWADALPEMDWPSVRWVIDVIGYVGGRRGDGQWLQTMGPCFMWRWAVYGDGRPAEYRWIDVVPEYPESNWATSVVVGLAALNYVNCVNVQLVEPRRPRAQARRLARLGVKVNVINVFPVSASTRSTSRAGPGVPLTSVRGHFVRYGPEFDRGLLFGKYAGRFWIPQYAKGLASLGARENDYRLMPDETPAR